VKRCLLILLLLPLNAYAWTLAADRRIASESAKHAPPDLLYVIKSFNQAYARGIETAVAEDAQGAHGRDLRQRIESETRNVVSMLKANRPMSDVVERLGILAHLMCDANNPYLAAGASVENREDFERYLEQQMTKFPTVVYRTDTHAGLAAILDRTFARSARFVPLMTEEYTRGTSESFDDLSTAFGVASVSYSHSITDTANLFSYIWREAGGVVLNAKN
jgi:hypothetical protein